MKKYFYICGPCSNKALNGQAAYSGRVYTIHKGLCDKCGKRAYLAHVNDYGLSNELVFTNAPPLD